MELFRLFGRIAVDNEEANDAIDETTGMAEQSENRMSGAFKKIGAAVAAAFAVDKIIDFGKQVVEASATVAAEQSAFEQIMGNYTDTANEKMNSIADNTGMVASRLTPYMTSLTAKFKGLGYDIGDATDLASDGLNLAADAAAFWDMSLDESMSHLNSFVNGSYEGGEAIGLFANDTQMASYAVSQGIVKQTKDWASLDEATKQATRLEYAQNMMKASGAVGQAAKESSQYANVQANLTEKWRQFKAQIGEPLLQNVVTPAMEKLGEIVDGLSPKFEALQKWVSENKTLLAGIGVVIGALTTGIIAYNVAHAAMTLGSKLHAAASLAEKLAILGVNTAMLTSPITWVVAGIVALIAIIVLLVKNWDKVKEAATKVWDKVKEIWGKVAEWFSTTVIEPLKNFFTGLKDKLSEIWEGIKNVISVALQLIVNIISFAIDLITLPWRLLWEGIKLVAEVIWNAIGDKVKNAINAIKTVITTVMNAIKTFFTNVWNGIKTAVTTVVNAIKSVITTVFNAIKSVIQTVMNAIKSVISTVWNAIKNVIVPIINAIKTVISNVFNAIKSTISNILNGIKSAVTTAFNAVKTAIEKPINAAKTIVQNGLNAIKGFFDRLKLKFPNIKLPHFSISGKFSLDPPSAPKLKIDWYAKAMRNAMLLSKPTIFGVNPGGDLMGGGEAGQEVVAGSSTLMNMIRAAVQSENSAIVCYLEKLISMLAEYFPEILANLDRDIVLDDGTLAGRLTPGVDEELGNRNKLRKRGM